MFVADLATFGQVKENTSMAPKSAIKDMSVAEVRRYLDFIRKQYLDDEAFFFPGMALDSKYTLEEFCLEFVRGNHTKRAQKRRHPS